MKKLTHDEQNALVARAQAGDRKATADLLAFVERDIQAIVAKMVSTPEDRRDLAQVARMAVLESAIPKFVNRGLQFRFYAALWARTEVKRSRNINSSVVPINIRTFASDLSLDAPMKDESDDTWGSVMEAEGPTPEEAYASCEDSERVRHAMERIISKLHVNANAKYDKRALCRDLVYNRLLSDTPVGLDVIAKRFNVARETVRKDEMLVIGKLARVLGAA